MESPMFFKNWAELGRAALLAIVAYSGFIILLRSSGKRTLAKMNVFDFVFVVALGSMLAQTILTPDITVSKGLVACVTLILFQMVLSWLASRSGPLEKIINGDPSLLFFRGQFLKDIMKGERVTEEEIRAAIRAQSLGSMDEVEAVVLETDGTFAVIWQKTEGSQSAMTDLTGQENESKKTDPKPKQNQI